ncbi:hypothetical protein [Bacillus sp. V2I10]|uniref:hypothetical protein n=1 Tax=Bacillus sp. V2I10 TaxID=3042276 RepID=UPI00277DC12D|nr:hypothetical protein [Bacillus sp. V2I10]MDQ0859791.1 hypothetical protein [Bacillus sp. V2I10]
MLEVLILKNFIAAHGRADYDQSNCFLLQLETFSQNLERLEDIYSTIKQGNIIFGRLERKISAFQRLTGFMLITLGMKLAFEKR